MAEIHVANVLEEAVYGGPHRRVVLAAASMRELDVVTTVLAPRGAHRLQAECLDRGIAFEPSDLSALSRDPRLLLRYFFGAPREVRRLAKQLRSTGCDLVHVSGGAWSFKTVLACHRAGLPFVWHMNDAYQPRPVLRLFRLVLSVCKPAGVLYSGIRAKEYYEDYFDRTVPSAIARPPVSEELAECAQKDTERPQAFGGAECTAVLIGNINKTKSNLDAIIAVRELIDDGMSLQLCLVGAVKDSQRAYFEECTQAAGAYWGTQIKHVEQVTDVRPYLLHADVSLCSSLSESGPLTVWESAALGCPIVSSDVGDVRAVLEPENLVQLFQPGDRSALKTALLESINDSQAKSRAANARRSVAAQLSAASHADSATELYRTVDERQNRLRIEATN